MWVLFEDNYLGGGVGNTVIIVDDDALAEWE